MGLGNEVPVQWAEVEPAVQRGAEAVVVAVVLEEGQRLEMARKKVVKVGTQEVLEAVRGSLGLVEQTVVAGLWIAAVSGATIAVGVVVAKQGVTEAVQHFD